MQNIIRTSERHNWPYLALLHTDASLDFSLPFCSAGRSSLHSSWFRGSADSSETKCQSSMGSLWWRSEEVLGFMVSGDDHDWTLVPYLYRSLQQKQQRPPLMVCMWLGHVLWIILFISAWNQFSPWVWWAHFESSQSVNTIWLNHMTPETSGIQLWLHRLFSPTLGFVFNTTSGYSVVETFTQRASV